jgi:putative endonuclease
MAWEWARRLFGGKTEEFDPLGDRGENVAAKHLRTLGYRILIRNYECKFGEVDIIARDGKMLVFVEVKTRKDSDPEPEEQVNEHKQRQVSKCAEFYLQRYSNIQPSVRFDVISVIWPRNQEPIIRHYVDAFVAVK